MRESRLRQPGFAARKRDSSLNADSSLPPILDRGFGRATSVDEKRSGGLLTKPGGGYGAGALGRSSSVGAGVGGYGGPGNASERGQSAQRGDGSLPPLGRDANSRARSCASNQSLPPLTKPEAGTDAARRPPSTEAGRRQPRAGRSSSRTRRDEDETPPAAVASNRPPAAPRRSAPPPAPAPAPAPAESLQRQRSGERRSRPCASPPEKRPPSPGFGDQAERRQASGYAPTNSSPQRPPVRPAARRTKAPPPVPAEPPQQRRPESPPIGSAVPKAMSPQELVAKALAEAEQADNQLLPCKHCGRMFSHEALAKHVNICQKVFQKKRKVFNPTEQRLPDVPEAADLKKAARQQARRGKIGIGKEDEKPESKWRQKSEQFREAMRAAQMVKKFQKEGRDLRDLPVAPSNPELDDRVPCPHCGRRFGAQQAERHIPVCAKAKARPNGPPGRGGPQRSASTGRRR